MRPRLVGPSGEIALGPDGATLGRNEGNSIRIHDDLVSGTHCRIEVVDDRFVLTDCHSNNGTLVNGRSITSTSLSDGDEIRIGQTTFRFFVGDSVEMPPSPSEIHLDEVEETGAWTTFHLRPADSSLLNPSHSMSELLKLTTAIHEASEPEELQNLVVERLLKLVHADNAAFVPSLADNTLNQQGAVIHRRLPDHTRIGISRTITKEVMATGQSILRNRLRSDASTPDSIRHGDVNSVLCVRVGVGDTRLGVLYLTRMVSTEEFDRGHLEIATAVAGIFAIALEHLRYVEWLETENVQLKHEASIQHEMVGQSARVRELLEQIQLVAPTTAPVLIEGESGTGKELVAAAVHKNSQRRMKPFVTFNCAELVASMASSQLFGYVKGAFTGADADRRGLIEEASGGTLFLDEIGEMPLSLQPILLRVLQEGEVLRVGSTKPIKVDIRLISATSRSLENEMENGRFRQDLYFRLGRAIEVPALRDRKEDIPLLVRFFLEKYRNDTQRELGITPPETIRALEHYNWPGNVRQLERVIQSAIIYGKSDRLRPEDLPKKILEKSVALPNPTGNLSDDKKSYERVQILEELRAARGNVTKAATVLQRAPTYLQRRINQLGLRDELERIRNGG